MKRNASAYAVLVCALGIYVFSLFTGACRVKEALVLCAGSLVPSIFCSVVFSLFLVKSGLWSLFGKKGVFATGLLCGAPSGAIMASELYRSGALAKTDAQRLCFIYSLPSPSFVIAYAGAQAHGSFAAGLGLYALLLLSVLLCDGLFYVAGEGKEPEIKCRAPLTSLVESVAQAGEKCITVCSFVAFFYVTASFVLLIGIADKRLLTLCLAFFEMTFAIESTRALDFGTAFVLSALALSFSGMSIACQVGFYAQKSGLSMKGYFTKRLALSGICTLLALLFTVLSDLAFTLACALAVFYIALKRKYLQKSRKYEKKTEKLFYERRAHEGSDKAKNEA